MNDFLFYENWGRFYIPGLYKPDLATVQLQFYIQGVYIQGGELIALNYKNEVQIHPRKLAKQKWLIKDTLDFTYFDSPLETKLGKALYDSK